MKILDTMRDVLRTKGHALFTLTPESTVYRAIEMMADKHVGALLVTNGEPGGQASGRSSPGASRTHSVMRANRQLDCSSFTRLRPTPISLSWRNSGPAFNLPAQRKKGV